MCIAIQCCFIIVRHFIVSVQNCAKRLSSSDCTVNSLPNLRKYTTKWKIYNVAASTNKTKLFRWNYSENAAALSLALSGWHVSIVFASFENNLDTYFSPTRLRSSMVTSLIFCKQNLQSPLNEHQTTFKPYGASIPSPVFDYSPSGPS